MIADIKGVGEMKALPPAIMRHHPVLKRRHVWPYMAFLACLATVFGVVWYRLGWPEGIQWAFFRSIVCCMVTLQVLVIRDRRRRNRWPSAEQCAYTMFADWAAANRESARWN